MQFGIEAGASGALMTIALYNSCKSVVIAAAGGSLGCFSKLPKGQRRVSDRSISEMRLGERQRQDRLGVGSLGWRVG